MFFVAIQGCDLVHFVVCEGEAEEVEIFTNMGWVAGAGDDDDAALQIPAQDDLGRGCGKAWAMCSDLTVLLTQVAYVNHLAKISGVQPGGSALT